MYCSANPANELARKQSKRGSEGIDRESFGNEFPRFFSLTYFPSQQANEESSLWVIQLLPVGITASCLPARGKKSNQTEGWDCSTSSDTVVCVRRDPADLAVAS